MNYNFPVRVVRTEFTTERTIVVSDIHGSAEMFRQLLEKLCYQPEQDTLVIIGDMLQKGPENLEMLHLAMELSKKKNVYILMGNNDLYVLEGSDEAIFNHCDYYREYSVLGEMAVAMGRDFPKSVEETHKLRKEAEDHFKAECDFIRNLPQVLETEKFIFAHAGLESEDLDNQKFEYVISTPRFSDNATHVFEKLLLVGHWPVSIFHKNHLSCAPHYNAEKNILSIDGGNSVKLINRLNGVVLNNKTGEWACDGVDEYEKISAPCSQTEKNGLTVCWPDCEVEVLEERGDFTLCKFKGNGAELEIPTEFLYEDDDGRDCTNDTTDRRLEVKKGETVSVVRKYADRLLIMKNGETGWLFL